MKKCGMMWIYVSALVIMFCAQVEADNYHCKVTVEADSEEVKEWEKVEDEFDDDPVDNVPDLIEVTNARKGVGKDIWPDPVNSNVILAWADEDPDEGDPVKVEVLRRENDRLVYSVEVELEVEGDGPGMESLR